MNEKLLIVSFQVADCILLMSLDQPSSIPVDTHVFQVEFIPSFEWDKMFKTKYEYMKSSKYYVLLLDIANIR